MGDNFKLQGFTNCVAYEHYIFGVNPLLRGRDEPGLLSRWDAHTQQLEVKEFSEEIEYILLFENQLYGFSQKKVMIFDIETMEIEKQFSLHFQNSDFHIGREDGLRIEKALFINNLLYLSFESTDHDDAEFNNVILASFKQDGDCFKFYDLLVSEQHSMIGPDDFEFLSYQDLVIVRVYSKIGIYDQSEYKSINCQPLLSSKNLFRPFVESLLSEGLPINEGDAFEDEEPKGLPINEGVAFGWGDDPEWIPIGEGYAHYIRYKMVFVKDEQLFLISGRKFFWLDLKTGELRGGLTFPYVLEDAIIVGEKIFFRTKSKTICLNECICRGEPSPIKIYEINYGKLLYLPGANILTSYDWNRALTQIVAFSDAFPFWKSESSRFMVKVKNTLEKEESAGLFSEVPFELFEKIYRMLWI